MFASHIFFEVVTDVGEGFAGNREELSVSQVYKVYLRGNLVVVGDLVAKGGVFDDAEHVFAFDGEFYLTGGDVEPGIFLDWCVVDNANGFFGKEVADADAFLPGLDIFSVFAAAVCRDHAALGTVHKDAFAAAESFDAVVERADEVRRHEAGSGAQNFGVNRVVHESNERLSGGIDELHNVCAGIVEFWGVIVVSNFSVRASGCDSDGGGLKGF